MIPPICDDYGHADAAHDADEPHGCWSVSTDDGNDCLCTAFVGRGDGAPYWDNG